MTRSLPGMPEFRLGALGAPTRLASRVQSTAANVGLKVIPFVPARAKWLLSGGNLAAVVSQLARDDGGPLPVLQWLLYPRTDFTAQTRSLFLFADGFLLTKHDIDWFHAQYLDGCSGVQPKDPRVSPLLADTLTGLPPALIAIAGFDPLRDEGERYATALNAAGNPVDLRCMGSLTHGFASLFPLGGGSATATAELISALRAHLSRG